MASSGESLLRNFWLVTEFWRNAELIIPCWKCPSCGKSEELTKEEYTKLKDNLICTHDWKVHTTILCSFPAQMQRTCEKCGQYERMYLDGSGVWFKG